MNLTDHAGVRLTHGKPKVNGVEIHYAIGGAGEPVFLLHGVPKTMSYWRHVVPLLTPHYTVIAVDNRGAGGSQRPQTGYDTATMAGDVAELATHLGFDQFRVAGEDWGAAIAYAVAAFYRPRVQQLVFQETLLPGWPARPGSPGGEHDPSLAADDMPHRLALQLLQPAERARAAAGRAGTAVLDVVRQTPDVGSQRAGRGGHRRNRALGRAAGRHQGHLGDVPRPPDRRRTEPPALRQPDQLPGPGRRRAGLSRGRSIQTARASGPQRPRRRHPRVRSQHRAGEPGRLAQAYLDFFAGG